MAEATFDPITLQSILQNLPEVQRAQKRADRLRRAGSTLSELSKQPGQGNYTPTQSGGLYQTVAQYQPDYSGLGRAAAGIGSYYLDSKADKASEESDTARNEQIMRAIEQIGQSRAGNAPKGGATEAALRGYLGLLGGPDVTDLLGKTPHVSSTKVGQDGNIWTQLSDGSWKNSGIKADYGTQIVTGQGGKQYAVGKSGAGRGMASPVTLGGDNPLSMGGSADMSFGGGVPTASGQPAAPTAVNFDFLTPEQNTQLGALVSQLPQEQADAVIQHIGANRGMAAAPGPGQQLTVPTKGQEAGEAEAARLAAQYQAANQSAIVEATKEGAKVDAQTAAKWRAELPQMEQFAQTATANAQKLLDSPGLSQIVGGLGGRIPDGPTAQAYFNAVMAGTPAADAMALHNQLKGEVFLQAFKTLKGGGQITEVEGQKAEQAMARMDRAQSLESYKQAVKDFVDAMNAGLAKIRAASQQAPTIATPQIQAPAAPAQLPPGFSWEP